MPAQQSLSLQRDRLVQHLAMGLALDCALTRLAREPDQFWAETRPAANQPGRYLLVLHPKREARLFTGAMLTFSSWCFMHDVPYNRSEVLCDAATHRPIEEKDYAGPSDLKGHYMFDHWLDDIGGAAPGRIRAVVPYEKDGRDQSLEMTAEFQFAKPKIWLLKEVQSHFRGTDSGSTGSVSVLPDSAMVVANIQELLERAQATQTILAGIKRAPDGEATVALSGTNWSETSVRAEWTDPARQSARDREKDEAEVPLLGVFRARILESTEELAQIELEGVSTASWKEFLTAWKVRLIDGRGTVAGTSNADLKIRAEAGPTPFTLRLKIARRSGAPVSLPMRVGISGTVQRLTGAYHGHGIWYTFRDEE